MENWEISYRIYILSALKFAISSSRSFEGSCSTMGGCVADASLDMADGGDWDKNTARRGRTSNIRWERLLLLLLCQEPDLII